VPIAVDNPGLALRLGMYMDLLFTNSIGGMAPVVPKQAIQYIGPASVVFLPVGAEPSRFLQRTVEVGEESVSGFEFWKD
jgi:hypothetical protein